MIRDATLAGPNLTVVTSKKIPRAEALRLIESTLLLNGYSFVPGPNNTLKVVNIAGKNPRSEGIPLLTRLADLPTGDQVVSFYVPLEFIAPSDAAAIFQASATLHSYGAIVPVPTAHAIVITEDSATIRQLLKLKDLIDIPPTKIVSEFVQLRRADAQKVADAINKLLDSQKAAASAGGNQPAAVPPGGGGNPGQFIAAMAQAMSAAQSSAAAKVAANPLASSNTRFVPDVRTNRILIVTEPYNFPTMKRLVEDFDLSADVMEPFSRSLKYIKAMDVLPVLGNLISETKDDTTTASAAISSAASLSRAASTQSRTASSNSSSSASGLSQVLAGDPEAVLPEAILVGSTRLIADNNSNSITVIGPPESVTKVSSILDKLDVRPQQLYLATVIGKMTLSNDSELSVNILQNYANYSGKNGVATSSSNGTAFSSFSDPRNLSSPGSFGFLSGLTLYGSLGHVLNYYVQALESTGRFTVLSRPSVYTANNKKAYISSGQQVPIPQSTLSSLDTTSSTTVSQSSTITYKNAALLLEVIPLINANKEVTLQIAVQNNTLNGSSTISGNSIPIIASDALMTTITVSNRSTIVLGGLIRNQETKNRTGVPILKDIPVIGALFRDDKNNEDRDELVVLIEPAVIENETDLNAVEKDEINNSKVGPQSQKYIDKTLKVMPEKGTVINSITH